MKLVLFDLDDTLIQGDSAKLWLKFCVEKGFLPQEYLEKIVFYQKQYQEKKLDMDEFIKIYIKPYEKAKELIIKYQDQRCIIISATAEFLVRKIASFLGVRESIAIKCERVGDKFSGKAYGIYSFKEGKVLRLKEYLGKDYEKWMKDSFF